MVDGEGRVDMAASVVQFSVVANPAHPFFSAWTWGASFRGDFIGGESDEPLGEVIREAISRIVHRWGPQIIDILSDQETTISILSEFPILRKEKKKDD